jgi:hypothetical protein
MFIDRPNFSAIDWAKDLQLIVLLSTSQIGAFWRRFEAVIVPGGILPPLCLFSGPFHEESFPLSCIKRLISPFSRWA